MTPSRPGGVVAGRPARGRPTVVPPAAVGRLVAVIGPCQGCGACLLTCPARAIRPSRGRLVVLPSCDGCGECVEVCPVDAVDLISPVDAVDLVPAAPEGAA